MHFKGLMTGALLGAAFLLVAPSAAVAGPVACAKAIKDCVGGGKAVAAKIKTSRNECEALRDCKKVCRTDRKDDRKEARGKKKDCKAKCKNKKGKAKRECKASCREGKRGANKSSKSDKKACIKKCKADYKTPACKDARRDMIKTIAKESLKCEAKVTAGCAP